LITISVYSSVPVSILPIVRRHDTEIYMFWCSASWIMRGNTFVCKMKGITASPPSLRYEKAQLMSEIISLESFSIRTFASVGTHLVTLLYCGAGLPLHKLLSVHEAFLVKVLPGTD